MNVDIKEVEKIFKGCEDIITEAAKNNYLSEDSRFFDKIRHLEREEERTLSPLLEIRSMLQHCENRTFQHMFPFMAPTNDKISMKPTYDFIYVLASKKGTGNIPQFQQLVSELADSNSPLIEYFIASNPNVAEETRIKIAQKENVDARVLTELAKNTKNIKLLEALIGNDDGSTNYDDVKIAALNNYVFSTSEKSNEYFTGCIEKFSISQLEQLRNIPEACKEDYEYFTKLRRIESLMSAASEKMDYGRDCGEDSVYDDASNEYNELQKEYDKLKSQRMQK